MKCKYCDTEHPEDQIANPHYCIARLSEQNEKLEEQLRECRLDWTHRCKSIVSAEVKRHEETITERDKLMAENEALKCLMDGDTDWEKIAKKAEAEKDDLLRKNQRCLEDFIRQKEEINGLRDKVQSLIDDKFDSTSGIYEEFQQALNGKEENHD